jgi:hypothetical protein
MSIIDEAAVNEAAYSMLYVYCSPLVWSSNTSVR